jgi:hypothetical protein
VLASQKCYTLQSARDEEVSLCSVFVTNGVKLLDKALAGYKIAAIFEAGQIQAISGTLGSHSLPKPGEVNRVGPLLRAGLKGKIHSAGEHTCL